MNESGPSFGTELILMFYITVLAWAAFVGFFALIFKDITAEGYAQIGITLTVILLICGLILGVLALLKLGMKKIYEKLGVKPGKQFECDVLIGLGLIAMGGYVPRIVMYFIEPSLNYVYYAAIIYPLACLMIYLIFLCNSSWNSFSLTANPYGFLIAILATLNILSMLIPTGIAFPEAKVENDFRPAMLVYSHMFLGIICTSSSIEFFMVLSGGMDKVKNKKLESVKVVKPDVVEVKASEVKAIGPKIECNICLLEYSDTLIPRMLTECGHTLCQKCAQNLLNKNNGLLFCPFCQVITAVNGTAATLPKNHIISDFLNGIKQN